MATVVAGFLRRLSPGLIGAIVLTACARERAPSVEESSPHAAHLKPDRVGLAFAPAPDDATRVRELEATLGDPEGEIARSKLGPSAAALLVYLAATSSSHAVQINALRAMAKVFSPHGKERPRPSEDYLKTVQHHLRSSQPQVQAAALEAARKALSGKTASDSLIETLVAMASEDPNPTLRFELVHTLSAVSRSNRNAAVTQVFRDAVSSAAHPPHVLASALHALLRATRTLRADSAVVATVESLTAHVNPGVRGRAVELLGAIDSGSPQVNARLALALSDEHPYVRARACEALARRRQVSAVHAIVGLLNDQARAEYTLSGWSRLSGAPAELRLTASEQSEVRHAALQALRSLGAGTLRLAKVDDGDPERALQDNIRRALAWYDQRKSSL